MKSTANNFYRESDNVYINISITHPDAKYSTLPNIPSIGTEPINAQYIIDNDSPFIDNSSEYYASIIRFDIPLNAVPLFICPVIPNQANAIPALLTPIVNNLTPFIIGIQTISNEFPVNLIFANNLSTLSAPIQDQQIQIITPYYYIYSYTSFIRMINTALSQAWVNAGQLVANSPYFYLENGIIALVVPPFSGFAIFINAPLYNYLGGFQYKFNGYNQINGNDYRINITSNIKANEKYPDAGVGWTRYFQEYSTLSLWSSIRKILIISTKLPIVTENITVGDNNTTRLPILTDFVPIINAAGDSRDIAYYLPSSQYRLTDMNGNTALQSFDIKIYWQDSQDNIYPLQITLFQQINIKIAFLRKDLYKNTPNI